MGQRIARAVALDTAPLSDRARLVLIRMSWAVLDKPSGEQAAAEYWRGWEWLGLPWDDGRSPDAVNTIVKRAVRELVSKGYLKPIGETAKGRRQHYVITIDY
jgi:hypothetical protein